MGSIPKITSYEDYDVLQGKNEATRTEWKESTFHDSEMNGSDKIFNVKAAVMEGSGAALETDSEFTETAGDKKAEANTKSEAESAGALTAKKMG